MKRIALVLSVLVLAAMACQLGGQLTPVSPAPVLAPTTAPLQQPAAVNEVQQQDALVSLFQRVNPGVVAILTVGN